MKFYYCTKPSVSWSQCITCGGFVLVHSQFGDGAMRAGEEAEPWTCGQNTCFSHFFKNAHPKKSKSLQVSPLLWIFSQLHLSLKQPFTLAQHFLTCWTTALIHTSTLNDAAAEDQLFESERDICRCTCTQEYSTGKAIFRLPKNHCTLHFTWLYKNINESYNST